MKYGLCGKCYKAGMPVGSGVLRECINGHVWAQPGLPILPEYGDADDDSGAGLDLTGYDPNFDVLTYKEPVVEEEDTDMQGDGKTSALVLHCSKCNTQKRMAWTVAGVSYSCRNQACEDYGK